MNNWDLVDSSAPYILGGYLYSENSAKSDASEYSETSATQRPRHSDSPSILSILACSDNLWERRIAIVATHKFIRNKANEKTFEIADLLIDDKNDLIQKAVGWMLREVGKNCGDKILETYLKPRYKRLGRTALRYSIERFSKEKRAMYLAGTI